MSLFKSVRGLVVVSALLGAVSARANILDNTNTEPVFLGCSKPSVFTDADWTRYQKGMMLSLLMLVGGGEGKIPPELGSDIDIPLLDELKLEVPNYAAQADEEFNAVVEAFLKNYEVVRADGSSIKSDLDYILNGPASDLLSHLVTYFRSSELCLK